MTPVGLAPQLLRARAMTTSTMAMVGPTSIGNSYDHFYNAYGSEGNMTLYFCSQLAVREREIKDRERKYLFISYGAL